MFYGCSWVGGRGLGRVMLALVLAVGSMVRQLIGLGAGWTTALPLGRSAGDAVGLAARVQPRQQR